MLNIALDPSIEQAYLDHFSQCEDCSSKLHQLDRESESLGELLTQYCGSKSLSDPRIDPVCQKMVDCIHAQGPSFKPEAEMVIPNIIRDYRLGRKIGQGGMGLVFEAEHIHLRKKLAIKILSPERVPNQRFVNRFKREMTVIGKLDHPNIVRATDAGFENQHHYLVMEYVDGLSLSQLVQRQGLQPVGKACNIILQAARGLQHAWDHSLVHRDIKPNNLMVTKNNETKILDLGLALIYEEEGDSISLQGQIMGTADYMAPEQWESSHSVDIRADLYSLGCTLYFLLSGQAPFKAFSRKMRAHLNEPFPSIRGIRKDVPAELDRIIEKLTAKNPCDRYATPNDLIRDLSPFATHPVKTAHVINSGNPVDENLTTQSNESPNSDRLQPALSMSLVPSEAIEKKKTNKLTWIIPFGILFSGICLAVALYRSNQSDQVPITYGEGAYKRNIWYDALAQSPIEFRWGNRNKIWNWNYDADKRSVLTHIERCGLLSLGKLNSKDFTLRVQTHQFACTGNYGVFLGGQINQDNEEVTFTRIELYQLPNNNRWHLKLGKTRLSRLKDFNDFHRMDDIEISLEPLRSEVIPQPYMLEIQVRDGRITSISWDGHLYPKLLDSPIPLPNSFEGEFGLFCRNTAVELTSAFLITH